MGIERYLEKFKRIINSKDNQKNLVISAIEKVIKIKIQKKNLDIRSGILYLSEKPIIKNEIFYKKQEIIDEINKNQKEFKILNIL